MSELNIFNQPLSGFEIGNIYSKKEKNIKTYYIAISHRTLVTWKNNNFGQFTCKKESFISENNISVEELCDYWKIKMKDFDSNILKYFQPDEEAKQRARREKQAREIELELIAFE